MITRNDMTKINFTELRRNEGLHTESNYKETFEKIGWMAKDNLSDYIKSTVFFSMLLEIITELFFIEPIGITVPEIKLEYNSPTDLLNTSM